MLQNLLRNLVRGSTKKPLRGSSFRPQLEGLEDRLVQSTAILQSGTLAIIADPNASLTVIRDKTNPANIDVRQNGNLVNTSPIPAAGVHSLQVQLSFGDKLTIDNSNGQVFNGGTRTSIGGDGNNTLVFQGGSSGGESFTPSIFAQEGSLSLGNVLYQFDHSVTKILDSTTAPFITVNEADLVTVQNGDTLNGIPLTDIEPTFGADFQVAGKTTVSLGMNPAFIPNSAQLHFNLQDAFVKVNNTVADPALKFFEVQLPTEFDTANVFSTPANVTTIINSTAYTADIALNLGASIKGEVTVKGGQLAVADPKGTAETITESSITGPGHPAINYSNLTNLQIDANGNVGEAFTVKASSSTASFNNLPLRIDTQFEVKPPTFDVVVNTATQLNLQLANNGSPIATVNVHNPDDLGRVSGNLNGNDPKLTIAFPGGSNSVISNVSNQTFPFVTVPDLAFTFDHLAGFIRPHFLPF